MPVIVFELFLQNTLNKIVNRRYGVGSCSFYLRSPSGFSRLPSSSTMAAASAAR